MKHAFSAPNAARDLADKTKWQEYERRTQAWIDEQAKLPMVAPLLFEAAVLLIGKQCGI